MSNTLQIISIQHELAMATGVELRLDPMLQQFTIVCLRRLGLVGMHFFLLQDESGNAVLPSNESHAGIRHYLSLPGDTGIEGDTTRFFEPASGASGFTCEHDDEQFIYCFRLGELGFVFFRRLAEPIDQAILLSLRPIISRLATSSHAALEHEQLLQAIDARKQAEEAVVFQL